MRKLIILSLILISFIIFNSTSIKLLIEENKPKPITSNDPFTKDRDRKDFISDLRINITNQKKINHLMLNLIMNSQILKDPIEINHLQKLIGKPSVYANINDKPYSIDWFKYAYQNGFTNDSYYQEDKL